MTLYVSSLDSFGLATFRLNGCCMLYQLLWLRYCALTAHIYMHTPTHTHWTECFHTVGSCCCCCRCCCSANTIVIKLNRPFHKMYSILFCIMVQSWDRKKNGIRDRMTRESSEVIAFTLVKYLNARMKPVCSFACIQLNKPEFIWNICLIALVYVLVYSAYTHTRRDTWHISCALSNVNIVCFLFYTDSVI